MRRLLPFLVVTLAATSCGGGDTTDDRPRTVTGRLMSVTGNRSCVSDDRGETTRCVDTGDPGDSAAGPEVGECVELTEEPAADGERGSIASVDESACAGGDLGP